MKIVVVISTEHRRVTNKKNTIVHAHEAAAAISSESLSMVKKVND